MNITSFLPEKDVNAAVMAAAFDLRVPHFSARNLRNLTGMLSMDKEAFALISVQGDGMPEAAFISDLRKRRINNMIYAVMTSDGADHNVTVRLLAAGADQAEKWPIDERLLVAQIKAILGRPREQKSDIFTFSGVTVNFDTGDVFSERGYLHFTPVETKVVKLICTMVGRIVTREMIHREIYSDFSGVPPRKIIDVYMCKIRKKIFAASGMDHIETRWGQGYVFVPDGFVPDISDHRVTRDHRGMAAE